jgi:NADH:ubiquinone oxidoreductase subunit 3 (subunit A)
MSLEAAYTQQYVLIGALTLAAVGLAVLPLALAKLIAPSKPGTSKTAAYECGIESTGDPWVQFRVQYYLYALLFVIFDVEVVFIYPWAIVWKSFGLVALVEMAIFLGILAVGLAYAWKKGVLEWE